MAENTIQVPARGNPEGAAGAGAASGGADQREDQGALVLENQKLKQMLAHSQQQIGRMSGEVHKTRQLEQRFNSMFGEPEQEEDEAPSSRQRGGADDEVVQQLRAIRARQDIMQFRDEHKDYGEYAKEVNELLNDDIEKATLFSYYPDGEVDWLKTLSHAKERAELRRVRESKQKAQNQERVVEGQRDALRNSAVISGGGAGSDSGDDSVIDVKQVMKLLRENPKALVEMGLLKASKIDPPTFMQG